MIVRDEEVAILELDFSAFPVLWSEGRPAKHTMDRLL
jgi:hypothetical protein